MTRALNLALIGKSNGDFGGVIHHVIVGENVAFRADDHARTEGFLTPFFRYIIESRYVVAEKLPEEGVQALRIILVAERHLLLLAVLAPQAGGLIATDHAG